MINLPIYSLFANLMACNGPSDDKLPTTPATSTATETETETDELQCNDILREFDDSFQAVDWPLDLGSLLANIERPTSGTLTDVDGNEHEVHIQINNTERSSLSATDIGDPENCGYSYVGRIAISIHAGDALTIPALEGDILLMPGRDTSSLNGGARTSTATGHLLEENELVGVEFYLFSGSSDDGWNGNLTLTDYAGGWTGPLPETPVYEDVHLADLSVTPTEPADTDGE